jgi:uncharacterized protein
MEFEWDAKKSASNKEKHGISFEEVEEAIAINGYLTTRTNDNYPGQEFIVFRADDQIYVAAVEPRGSNLRIVTVYRSRKMEKKYGP